MRSLQYMYEEQPSLQWVGVNVYNEERWQVYAMNNR